MDGAPLALRWRGGCFSICSCYVLIMEAAALAETRCFFAVVPDEEARVRIGSLAARLKAAHRMNGALIRPRNLHVSLYGLGDPHGYDDWLRIKAQDTARRVDLPPFEVAFDYT
ncbi:MAG: hypothetical protein J0H30_09605, partial [Alphaproteobacteria bacterium]|nr:hypothetical protein [Alphaproteobacteria bacterium]